MAGMMAKIPQMANSIVSKSRPRVETFLKFARVELAPPTPGDIPKAITGFRNVLSSFRTGRYKQLTVRDAWLNTLVGLEVGFWFFIGECIGKRHLIGYNV